MKPLKLILYIPLLLLLALQTSCKKEPLTKETQTGANTFSCKINGKVFTPCEDGFFSGGPSLYAHFSNNFKTLNIAAKCTQKNPSQRIYIDINNFHGVGEYLLSDINNSCTYLESNPVDSYYESKLTLSGKVVITKDDRINFIVSGTFEFTATNTNNPSDIATISSGRFDLKIN